MTQRTVLVAHPSPDLYGSDRVALGTVEALARRGHRVVVTLPRGGPLVPAIEAAGGEVVLCRSPVLRKSALRPGGLLRLLATTVRSLPAAVRLLRACDPDVVYVSTLTLPAWAVLARLAGRRCVCHVHEAESGIPAVVRRALALPLLLSDSIAANSEFSRSLLVSAFPRLRARSQVLPNPVPSPARVTPAREELTGPLRAIYVGRLSPRKGPHVAIAAVDELRARGVDVRLRLLGSVVPGHEWFADELRASVASRRLGERVSLPGFAADVWPAIAEADVVLVPSVADESFGNAAVEAVLAARPVIASDGGGLREATAGYSSAQVVRAGDPVALADAIEKVVANWPGYRAAAAADVAVAAERHSPARYGERLERFVLAAAGPSRSARGPGEGGGPAPAGAAERRRDPARVLVAVVTFQRPAGLARVLAEVLAQLDDVGGEASILVVDNDPAGSAMRLAPAFSARPVRFVHEPAPGIASARNRALDECGEADVLVFIDDDERPQPGWLRALVGEWRRSGAAAVVGPVASTYPHEPEAWIAKGGFFDRRRLPTGAEVTVAATNNLLLDVATIRELGLRFDPGLGVTGGSDTLFTRQLHRRGGRMVWCAEARVVDVVPPSRLTRRWVLARALRTGNGWSRVALMLEDGRTRRALRRIELTVSGLLRVGAGLARVSAGAATGSTSHRARGARTLARGLGMASGAWGYTYAEYSRRVDGRGALAVLESFGPPHPRSNPYVVQLAGSLPPPVRLLHFSWRRALLGRYDVFHVHWPEVFLRGSTRAKAALRAALYVLVLARLRLQRRALVRTLHNLAPHEPLSWPQRLVMRLSDRWTTLWVALTELTPPPTPAPVVVAPIGHHRDWFAGAPACPPVPGRILHFGRLRRYKGVEALLSAFSEIADDGLTLRIVGEAVDRGTWAAIERACRSDHRISAGGGYVPDRQLAREIVESELVVLPFTQVTNSSSVILALSLERPVLVPAAPTMEELAAEVGEGWVLTYRGPLDGAALTRALAAARRSRARRAAPPDLTGRDWPAIGRQHALAFARARELARRRCRG